MDLSVSMAPRVARALGRLEADLKTIFGGRLASLVLYGRHVPGTSATAAALDGATPGGWTSYARLLEQAGASGIELDLYHARSDPRMSSAEVERERDRGMQSAV